jgi:hypothetical protein
MSFPANIALWSGPIQAVIALLLWFGLDFKRVQRMTAGVASLRVDRNKIILFLIVGSLVWSTAAVYFSSDYRKTDWMGHDSRWKMFDKQKVVGRHFIREAVTLDGNHFINCTFEETTLIYNALAPYELTSPTFIGTTNIKSDNARIGALITLMSRLGMLPKTDIRISP